MYVTYYVTKYCWFSHSVVSYSFRLHGLQHARLPCPSPTPGAYSDPCPSSQWCHATISSSVVPFFSHLQSFPASGSFPVNEFFASGGQSIGVSASASFLPVFQGLTVSCHCLVIFYYVLSLICSRDFRLLAFAEEGLFIFKLAFSCLFTLSLCSLYFVFL